MKSRCQGRRVFWVKYVLVIWIPASCRKDKRVLVQLMLLCLIIRVRYKHEFVDYFHHRDTEYTEFLHRYRLCVLCDKKPW